MHMRALCSLRRCQIAALALAALPAWSQQRLVADFTRARPDAGWALSGTASLTAPAVDAEGLGWLRLTGNANQQLGRALQNTGGVSAKDGLSISFRYVAWGGGNPGADGISVFLYDASQDMAGAASGGGLGYCKGAGGWLGLALDEYGNFSHPQDGCAGGGGPGNRPQTLTLRGPASAKNPLVAQAGTGTRLDSPDSNTRGTPSEVAMHLSPRTTGGFEVSVDWRRVGEPTWIRLIERADFPFQAPSSLRIGVAATTGGARNTHEVSRLTVLTHVPIMVTQKFDPPVIRSGGISTLTTSFSNAQSLPENLARTLVMELPQGMAVAAAPELGGTCAGGLDARAGGRTVSFERGALLRATGCTVTVDVTAAGAGKLTSSIPSGAVTTQTGSNVSAASAVLTVQP